MLSSKIFKGLVSLKKEKAIFVCQLSPTSLKVVKCVLDKQQKRKFIGLEEERFPAGTADQQLKEKLNSVFKKLQFRNAPLILSLPRHSATCRYLKVPSTNLEEIERIANLQAPRYLPYAAEELITASQIISSDTAGYSHLNLVIAHKDVITRNLSLLCDLKAQNLKIVLSSYGLAQLYQQLRPEFNNPAMVVDLQENQVELAILKQGKLLFSRSFKLAAILPDGENLFLEEINKTQDAYLREVAGDLPAEVMVVGAGKLLEAGAALLKKRLSIPVTVLAYAEKMHFTERVLNTLLTAESSFAGLLGLALADIPESLSLMLPQVKERLRNSAWRKQQLRLSLFIFSIIFIGSLGVLKNMDNQAKYLERLKMEVRKITQEAASLEQTEKRFRLLQERSGKKASSLEVLYELHQLTPADISLVSLGYEEDKQLTLRGQARELNSLSIFVQELESSAVLRSFDCKVRYATQKRGATGDFVDFELVCSKK